ncbi:hypothetical protein [Streptomyces jumonjinensis]|uniref:hypothetical protein n=1 Tax=Streptomyces jumonjinensis TaxID=1945 RepID=UPI0037897805
MRRKAWALTALAGGALLLAGCGIRTTQVPVDAGPAPSRMPCEIRGENLGQTPKGFPVRVYLVCASQLKFVDRAAELPSTPSPDDRIQVARALLAELQRTPPAAEREAGFGTDVRGPVAIGDPRPGDPEGALRLNRQPEDLPAEALAQIVCTFAESRAAAADGSVILAGPGAYPPRAYACSDAARNRPSEPLPTLTPSPSPSSSSSP